MPEFASAYVQNASHQIILMSSFSIYANEKMKLPKELKGIFELWQT
jgi:hypothetical protein